MTTFYLVRHAEKDSDERVISGRRAGIRLTPLGRAQADRIARRLRWERIDAIYSSPLERAQDTASPLAQLTSHYVRVSAALDEVDFGVWTGKTHEEVAAEPEWQRMTRFRAGALIPGGETYLDVQARFVNEMLRLRRQYSDQSVALFSHADPIRAALAYFAGAPPDPFDRFEVGVASISVVTIDDYRAQVVRVNEQP